MNGSLRSVGVFSSLSLFFFSLFSFFPSFGVDLCVCVCLQSFAQDATNEFSGPFETVAYPVTIAGAKEPRYVLRLFDTDSDELFSRIRAITYKTTDLFLVCFDLTNEDTFKNARSWYAEVNQLSSKIPVILVGTKADKVGDVKVNRRLADSMREDAMMIYNYVEVDASDPQHVKKLLDLAVSYLAL